MSKLVTGDDTDVSITLVDVNGEPLNVSTASSIQARLVSLDRSTYLTPVYTCEAGATGANWAQGKIVVNVLGTDTASISEQLAKWEVQSIVSTRKRTYFDLYTVEIVKGWVP